MYSLILAKGNPDIAKIPGLSVVAELSENAAGLCRDKIREALVRELLVGTADLSEMPLALFGLDAPVMQVVLCESYNGERAASPSDFAQLLQLSFDDESRPYEHTVLDGRNVFLLKGESAVESFQRFLESGKSRLAPPKSSAPASLFIAYGQSVDAPEAVRSSYHEACRFLERRFFCAPNQHIIGKHTPPYSAKKPSPVGGDTLADYRKRLLNCLQTSDRRMLARTLFSLRDKLCESSDSVASIRLFLAELYLGVKEQAKHMFINVVSPSSGSDNLFRCIFEKNYLYEIIDSFAAQLNMIAASVQTATCDGILDDIVHYIECSYTDSSISLGSIASLYGYNSSYLGKVFSSRTGESFGAYLDRIRIEKAKELLLESDMRVYAVAMRVGFCNADYFCVKFRKYVGQSPSEFRQSHMAQSAP